MPSVGFDEKSFQAREDLRTLTEAEKIRKSRARMAAAQREAREQAKAAKAAEGLLAKAKSAGKKSRAPRRKRA